MKRERDAFEVNAEEDIVKLANEGKLDELKKYAATEIMGCIKGAFTAALEGAQLGVMKYLWEVCSQENGMLKARKLWEEVYLNYMENFDFIEICKRNFKEDQWDLVIWFFGKLFREFKGDGGLELEDMAWDSINDLIEFACSKDERSLKYLTSFWKELNSEGAYGGTHFASACLESICARNDLGLLKQFVNTCDINLSEWVNGGDPLCTSPLLFIAFRKGCSTEFAQYLLKNGGELYAVCREKTLLHLACEANSLALVEFLFIQRGVEITSDWVNFRGSDGSEPHAFHVACASSGLAVVSFLFKMRGLFSPHPEVLVRGFQRACAHARLDVVTFLYENRSLFLSFPHTVTTLRGNHDRHEDWTVFHVAAINNNIQAFAILKYLLEQEYAYLQPSLLAQLRIFLQPENFRSENKEEKLSLVLFFEALKLLEQENPDEAQIISSLKLMNKDVLDKCLEAEFLRPCDESAYLLKANQSNLLKCLLSNKLSANAPFKDHWGFITRTFIQAANKLKEASAQQLVLYYGVVFADASLSLIEDDQEVGALLSVVLCGLRDLNKPDKQSELSPDHHSLLKKYPRDLWTIIKDISNHFSGCEFRLTSKFLTIECADYLIKGSSEKTESLKQSPEHSIKREGPGIFDRKDAAKRGRTDQDKEEHGHEEESEHSVQGNP